MPGAIRPLAIPLRRIFSRSRPRPSSSTRIATRSPSWPATRVIRPTRGFPLSIRSWGGSSAWSTALRIRWTMGSPSRSTIVRSSRVSWPTIRRSISLPDRSARSRTTRGNREKSSSTGTIRSSRVVSRISRLTRLERLESVEPGGDAGLLAQALEVVGEDHELARQADQVVELEGVDADPRVRPAPRGTATGRRPGCRSGRARRPRVRCRGCAVGYRRAGAGHRCRAGERRGDRVGTASEARLGGDSPAPGAGPASGAGAPTATPRTSRRPVGARPEPCCPRRRRGRRPSTARDRPPS